MYEVKENKRVLPDGTKITTYTREICSCNILSVEAGTTGYMGGDSGHGGRSYFRISDEACTDMRVCATEDKYGSPSVEVFLGGDTELETIITALKFIVRTLEDQRSGIQD